MKYDEIRSAFKETSYFVIGKPINNEIEYNKFLNGYNFCKRSRDKEISELKENIKEAIGYVDDMIKDRDAYHTENEKLEENLKIAKEYISKMYEAKYEPDKINIYYRKALSKLKDKS